MEDINIDCSSFMMPDIKKVHYGGSGNRFSDLATLKDKIEMHRRGRKMNGTEFCKKVGISRVTYWRFKRGLVDGISVEVLVRMLDVLGCEVLLLRKEDVDGSKL
jgi:DNA-binding Xre family transcriptional regulator